MNVSLTPKLEAFIRHKVASGLYNNASEVIREALRLLVAREDAGTGTVESTLAPSKAFVRARLADLEGALRERGVTSLAVFGSVLHGTARPGSDIDVLVGIDPRKPFSLVDLAGVRDLLEDRLGHPVDVVTRDGIDPAIRERVQAEAEPLF